MSNSDSPAGSTGGPVTVPALNDLPEKMRVHALAKLLVRTSREVLAALADLGVEVRSAQSSIDRKVAEQVVTALLPDAARPGSPVAAAEPAAPEAVAPKAAAPEAAAPEAKPARRTTRKRVTREPAAPQATTSETETAAPETAAPEAAAEEQAAPAEEASAAGTAAPLAPLFAPPTPLFQAPTRPARTRRAAAEPAATDSADATDTARPPSVPFDAAAPEKTPRKTGRAPEEQADPASTEKATEPAPAADGDSDDADDDGAARRRRRRGRRGRGRGRGGDGFDDENGDDSDDGADSADAADGSENAGSDTDAGSGASTDPTTAAGGGESESDDESDSDDDSEDSGQSDDSAGSRRRRRRRRRKGSGDDSADSGDDADPPNTVTRVRTPRAARSDSGRSDSGRSDTDDGDGVQSVRGSTRLEAKRQRRRDGRDAGRRRVPILSEAEFLARRESVDRSMVVREHGGRVEVAVLEDEILVEHFVTDNGGAGPSMVGNIYLGRVQNVLPSMEAAFVDIGRGRNAVLYAGEVDWDAAGLGGKARRIEQALSSGDSVLVQVTKDPIGHKGARLTTQISLAGRFLVYVPSGGAAGISRKLPDVERKRLKDMLKEIVPSEAGVIIRTASEGVSHAALERDVRRLQAQWEVVKTRSELTGPNKPKAPVLLYEEPDLLIKVVRDQFNEDFSRLVVEGDDAWDTLQNYVGHVAPELADRLHRHVGQKDVFAEYRIDEQLLKALDRKVWLPSGGTLVIDRTEAMTVIDVNTGKYTGSGGNLEETVTRNNLEAAEEVVRQLRLRDIGGIIVVDFIDMVLEANRDLVLRRLTECLSRDRTRHQVAEVTSLGLVQMTRKRVGGGLLEHFSTPCEHCRGRGVIVNAEPIAEKAGAGTADRGDNGRSDRSEGSGRRSRRGRGDDRNGHDSQGEGRQNGSQHGSGEQAGPGRNGARADRSDAAVDVGAPTPVVEPAAAGPAALEAPVVEAPVIADVAAADAADAPVVDAPAVEPPLVEVPAAEAPGTPGRRGRRVARRGFAEAGPPAAPVDIAAGAVDEAVEEVVVERSVAQQAEQSRADAAPAPVEQGSSPAGSDAPEGPPAEDAKPKARQRRGRVTRTAGAPAAAAGEAPAAAVVTVPSTPAAASEPAPIAVPPQPEPTVATRPRRARRAASRPAGPPVADASGDPV